MSWNDRLPFDEGLAKLKRMAEKPARTDRPAMIARPDIHMAVSVFQPRLFQDDLGDDEAHVRELVRAIKAKPKQAPFLDPVLVMAIGGGFTCIDGMHRLLAYKRAGVDGPIPVEHWEGSIEDAIKEAVLRNARDKLAMTNDDKLEAAWRLTVLEAHSKREVSEATGVAQSTIGTMRATLKKLQADESADDPGSFGSAPRPIPATWREAKRALSGDERQAFGEEQQAAMAREWARRFARAFGTRAVKQVGIFADAIEIYSRRLPRSLVEHWSDLAEEIATAMADDLTTEEDP